MSAITLSEFSIRWFRAEKTDLNGRICNQTYECYSLIKLKTIKLMRFCFSSYRLVCRLEQWTCLTRQALDPGYQHHIKSAFFVEFEKFKTKNHQDETATNPCRPGDHQPHCWRSSWSWSRGSGKINIYHPTYFSLLALYFSLYFFVQGIHMRLWVKTGDTY